MEIVERNVESLQVLMELGSDPGNQIFRRDALATGSDHDWRAMRVGSADIGALMAPLSLETRPDIGLDVLHQVTHMRGSVGIRQRTGHHHFSYCLSHFSAMQV